MTQWATLCISSVVHYFYDWVRYGRATVINRGLLMAQQCQLCGKKPRSGNNVSHSNRKTRRRWLPNLQTVSIAIEGFPPRVRICTSCIKTISRKLVA